MAGNDSDTVLLLNCDGTVGGTTFLDSSVGGTTHTVTANGDAQIVSGGKFLQGCDVNGTGYLSIPQSSDTEFGTGDFALDGWFSFDDITSIHVFFSTATDASNYIDCYFNNSDGKIYLRDNGVGISGSYTPTVGVLTNYLFCRISGVGYIYAGGVLIASGSLTGNMSTTGGFIIGRMRLDTSLYLKGVFDEIRVSKGNARIDDPDDPLYISSGIPADGFTPPEEAYSSAPPKTGFSLSPQVQLRHLVNAAFSLSPRVQLAQTKSGFSIDPAILLKNSYAGFSIEPKAQLLGGKQGFSLSPQIQLLREISFGQYSFPPRILTRSEIAPYYYFWIIDSNGNIIQDSTQNQPDISFPDIFTSIPYPAQYTLRAQARARYHNTDIIYGETILDFELDSLGEVVVYPAIPNTPFDLQHNLTAGGGVSFNWQYDPVGQLSEPEEYVIYLDDVETETIKYYKTTTSRGELSGLPETLTKLEVSARSLTGESERISVEFTPDSTPPDSPAVYLQIV